MRLRQGPDEIGRRQHASPPALFQSTTEREEEPQWEKEAPRTGIRPHVNQRAQLQFRVVDDSAPRGIRKLVTQYAQTERRMQAEYPQRTLGAGGGDEPPLDDEERQPIQGQQSGRPRYVR